MKPRPLHIGIIGTRGIPARYGGFETFAEELSKRLVARGHQVTVYCRRALYPDAVSDWNGVRRIDLPAIPHKYLETVSHAFVSALDAMRRDFDVVLVCNAVNAFTLPLLKLARFPTAINVDGIERRRKKWNALGRLTYMLGESMSARLADVVVADAEVIARYYETTHAVAPVVIAYGADFPEEADSDVLERLGVSAGNYLLYVSRMEPENNPIAVLEAYKRSGVTVPLVMIGSAPYADALLARLRAETSERVIWPGALYGGDYRTLQRNARLYIQATEVGGTHPALIEAMASGGAVVALDTPENREVGGEAVHYFRFEDGGLEALLKKILDDPSALDVFRTNARARARRKYSWDAITSHYEALFRKLAGA